MAQLLKFRMHWTHNHTVYIDELCAPSTEAARQYFIDHKRDDVSLARVQFLGPDDGGVREPSRSPDSLFDPLKARRRLDRDEDAP